MPASDLRYEREVATRKAVASSIAKTRAAAEGIEQKSGDRSGGGGRSMPPWRGAVFAMSETASKEAAKKEAQRRKPELSEKKKSV